MDWTPIPPDKCSECGRYTPGWYENRNADIADAYESGVTSVRIAKAYNMTEGRVIEIITQELGRREFKRVWHIGGSE